LRPAFFQRNPLQVQAIQWPATVDPEDVAASARFAEDTATIFGWVTSHGGTIVWRDTGSDFFPAIVTDAGDIPVGDGDWIVRLPDRLDADGKPTGVTRFIAETAADFGQDYQRQQRDLLAGQKNFLAQIDSYAKQAEKDEESMTPAERREAASVELHSLSDVVGKSAPGVIRDLRS
jgi:hypothetical protein